MFFLENALFVVDVLVLEHTRSEEKEANVKEMHDLEGDETFE